MSDQTNNLDDVLDFLDSTPNIDILETNIVEKKGEDQDDLIDYSKETLPPIDILDVDPDEEEEEEEEEEKEINIPIPDNEEEEEEDHSKTGVSQKELLSALGKHFSKLDMLSLKEGEDPDKIEWSEETFIERAKEKWEDEAWIRIEQLATEKLGEAGTEFVQKVLIDGMPYHEFFTLLGQEETIDSLDPHEDGEKILRGYYKAMGLEDDDIEEQIEIAVKNDTVASKAAKFKARLVENTKAQRDAEAKKAKALQEDREKRSREIAETYANTLKEAVKEGDLNGVPVSQADMKTLFNFVMDRPHVLANGQKITEFELKLAKLRAEDPSKFLTIAKILMDDVNLKLVSKTKQTKAVNSLFDELKGSKSSSIKPKKQDYSFLFKS